MVGTRVHHIKAGPIVYYVRRINANLKVSKPCRIAESNRFSETLLDDGHIAGIDMLEKVGELLDACRILRYYDEMVGLATQETRSTFNISF